MTPSIIGNDAIQGEVFLPGQIFVFGGFVLRANLLGHLEQIESYALLRLELVLVFPEEEGMMQQSSVSISLSF